VVEEYIAIIRYIRSSGISKALAESCFQVVLHSGSEILGFETYTCAGCVRDQRDCAPDAGQCSRLRTGYADHERNQAEHAWSHSERDDVTPRPGKAGIPVARADVLELTCGLGQVGRQTDDYDGADGLAFRVSGGLNNAFDSSLDQSLIIVAANVEGSVHAFVTSTHKFAGCNFESFSAVGTTGRPAEPFPPALRFMISIAHSKANEIHSLLSSTS
jgi:hypothetical protein